MQQKIDDVAAEIRREYFRKWRAANKDKVRQHNENYSIAKKVAAQYNKIHAKDTVYLTGGLCDSAYIRQSLAQHIGRPVASAPLAHYAGAIGAAVCAQALEEKN
ncbi:MAG: FGGY-family carbohydrate kinase [Oscillospiraceae bacterium]